MPEEKVDAVQVVDHDAWWLRDPINGLLTHTANPGHPLRPRTFPYAGFFRSSQLMADLVTHETARTRRDGGALAVFEARPRGAPLSDLPPGAETYELTVNTDRDVVVLVRAFAGEDEFAQVEMLDLDFDITFDAELFRWSS